MIIRFSASKSVQGKVAYKNYEQVECELAELPEYFKKYSVSSGFYKAGVTAKGEHCEGHRAGASCIGMGNLLLIDIDNKILDLRLDGLKAKLAGCAYCITPSRNWSEEKEKYHVGVVVDAALPLDQKEFTQVYKAVIQKLGLGLYYDTAMETGVQQFMPHRREDVAAVVSVGEPLSLAEALDSYQAPPEGESEGGVVGEIREGVLVSGGEVLSISEAISRTLRDSKLRVDCVHVDDHKDAAFLALHEGVIYYHCSGHRCANQSYVVKDNPFTPTEAPERAAKAVSLADIIKGNPAVAGVYGGPKPPTGAAMERAICYAITEQLNSARVMSGQVKVFRGGYWRQLWPNPQARFQYIKEACISAGFDSLALTDKSLSVISKYIDKSIPVAPPAPSRDLLNFQNCTLEISHTGMRVHNHRATDYLDYILPYNYDPEAACPTWELIVDRIMLGRESLIKAFQEAMGYLLLRDFNLEKMVVFVGEGENGKSTVLRTLKRLVGAENASETAIQNLVGLNSSCEYYLAGLSGKLINITTELSTRDMETGRFKALVSGEPLDARLPYGQPFQVTQLPKQIVAANTTDRLIQERSHGFERRLHLIPFNYRLRSDHKDPDLNRKLDSELSGILNWCLEGSKRVINNRELSVSSEMRLLFAQVQRENNPFLIFLETCWEADDDHETLNDVFYLSYRRWAQSNGLRPLGKIKLMENAKKAGVKSFTRMHTVNGKRKTVRGFRGLLVEEEIPDTKVIPFTPHSES
jgi:putative DNA primase/helicase